MYVGKQAAFQHAKMLNRDATTERVHRLAAELVVLPIVDVRYGGWKDNVAMQTLFIGVRLGIVDDEIVLRHRYICYAAAHTICVTAILYYTDDLLLSGCINAAGVESDVQSSSLA